MTFRILAASLLLLGCASAPETPPIGPVPENGYLPVVERVADNVHVVRQSLPNFAGVVGNVAIIEQSDSIVLVDSGVSHGWGVRVVEAVRRISRKPVSAVVITHWHGDHPLGLTAIREAWPDVEIISTVATRDRISTEDNGVPAVPRQRDLEYEAQRVATLEGYAEGVLATANDASLSAEERAGWARARSALPIRAADVPGTYVIVPNRTFTDSLTLPDRQTPVEIRFEGRANTEGDAIVWLPHQRVLIAGDIVVWPIPYNFNIQVEDNIRTLERLRAYDFATVVPGHGVVLRDKTYLDRLIAFNRDVQTQTAALAAQGLSLEDVTARVELETHARAFAGDDPWLRVWFRDYAANPLIESAYQEANGAPPPS